MSEFDREAERERLREKYERDKQKREATQRMSELLLKGATMTNHHCDTCGDPIFRWEGQEFCPTCDVDADASGDGQVAIDPGASDHSDAQTVAEVAETADAEPEAADADEDATAAEPPGDVDAGDVPVRTPDDEATPDAAADAGTAADTSGDVGASGTAGSVDARTTAGATPTAGRSREPVERATGQHGQAVDHAAVAASLSRTLARFAEAAEATEDPRRAREFLEAAREAAETLAALDRH
jgi:uncharacterized Zn finger protein (UPF0148 family)